MKQIIYTILPLMIMLNCQSSRESIKIFDSAESFQEKQYVNIAPNSDCYDKPTGQNKIATLQLGAEVERSKTPISNRYKIKTNEIICFLNSTELSDSYPIEYFKVVTRSGLNLRAEPNINSKVNRVIPFKRNGEVLFVAKNQENIQKQYGQWLKVKYQNEIGYIFSGFVLRSDSEKRLNEIYESLIFKVREISSQKMPVGTRTLSNKFEINSNWVVSEYTRSNSEPYCDYKSVLKNVNLFNKSSGREYFTQIIDEYIDDTRYLDRNIIVVKSTPCICCCAGYSHAMLLFQPDKVFAFHFQYGKAKSSCGEHGNYASEAKINNERIFYYVQTPACYSYISDQMIAGRDSTDEYMERKFLIIERDGTLKEFDTIPKSIQAEWNAAQLLLH